MKHTPAPWAIDHGQSRRVYLVNDAKGHAVGEIVYSDTRNPSDAQLIAAAPDLLAALESLAGYFEGHSIIDAELIRRTEKLRRWLADESPADRAEAVRLIERGRQEAVSRR